MMQYLCRDCFAYWEGAEGREGVEEAMTQNCHSCGSLKLLSHEELFSLNIAHLDCDSFYTSVEKRDNPSIATKPVIVGGRDRGVVAAACYVARIYGVRSAMPMFQALKRCPKAVVIAPNMAKYKAAGYEVRKAMRQVTAKIEPISIDEAYLDLSDNMTLHNEPACVSLAKLADTIEKQQNITVSIGLSYNKFLAKLASDIDKPKGFYVIGKKEAIQFLEKLSVRKLWGVGPQSAKKMMKHGWTTIGHVQQAKVEDLMRVLGKAGYELYLFANGEDNRSVVSESQTKSVSSETTFAKDISSLNGLLEELSPLCEQVAKRLKGQRLLGHVVVIKLKDSQFKNATRSKKYGTAFDDEAFIRQAAESLLQNYWDAKGMEAIKKGGGFRLLGVGVSDIIEADNIDRDIFDFAESHPLTHAGELSDAIKDIKKRFGESAIGLRDDD